MDLYSTPVKEAAASVAAAAASSTKKKQQSDCKKLNGRITNAELRALASKVKAQLDDDLLLLVTLWESAVDSDVWDDAEKQVSAMLEHISDSIASMDVPLSWQSQLQLSSLDELQHEVCQVLAAAAADRQAAVKEFVLLCCSFEGSAIQACFASTLQRLQNDGDATGAGAAHSRALTGAGRAIGSKYHEENDDDDVRQIRAALRTSLQTMHKLCDPSPRDRIINAIDRLKRICDAVAQELSAAGDEKQRNLGSLPEDCKRVFLLGRALDELAACTSMSSSTTRLVAEAITEEATRIDVGESAVGRNSNTTTIAAMTSDVRSASITTTTTTILPPISPPPSSSRRTPSPPMAQLQQQQWQADGGAAAVAGVSALQAAVTSLESPYHHAFLALLGLLQAETPSKVWGTFQAATDNASEVMDAFVADVLGSTCQEVMVVKRKGGARFQGVQHVFETVNRVFRAAGVVPRPITTVAMDTFRCNEAACRGLVDAVLQHLVLEIQELYPHAALYYLPESGVTQGNGRPVDYVIFCGGKVIAMIEVKADDKYRNAVSERVDANSMNASWAQLLAYAEQATSDRAVELFLCATTGFLWQSAIYHRMIPAMQRGAVEDIFLVQDHVPRQSMHNLFAFIVRHIEQCMS